VRANGARRSRGASLDEQIRQRSGAAPSERPRPQTRVLRVEPTRGFQWLRLRELWEYRELLYFLSWRDIKVRYKQAVLGAGWAIVQPLLTMVVLSLVFGRLAGIPSEGVPYPILSFAALVPWTFFSTSITQASNSMLASVDLVRKVYFPRIMIPVAAILPGLLDLAIAFLVLVAMMLFYGIAPTVRVVWVPLFVLLAFASAAGVGLWLSALSARYRDVRFVVPFLTQLGLFATPIAYPSSLVQEPLRTLLGLNPMSGVVEGFRWALLGTEPSPGLIGVSIGAALVLLLSGLVYFGRMERTFADVI
jgi:lipopolysaccharide transport system permease protein